MTAADKKERLDRRINRLLDDVCSDLDTALRTADLGLSEWRESDWEPSGGGECSVGATLEDVRAQLREVVRCIERVEQSFDRRDRLEATGGTSPAD